MARKANLLMAVAFAMAFCISVSAYGETVHTIDFEYLASEIGPNWSWNNTTDRTHSGMMPEGFLYGKNTETKEAYPGWELDMYYDETTGFFDVKSNLGTSSVTFSHLYQDWGNMLSWGGTGLSTVKDTTPNAQYNEMASLSGSGANNSDAYAVVYAPVDMMGEVSNFSSVVIPDGAAFVSMMINNVVYTFNSMAEGDGFAASLYEEDAAGNYLKLVITGFDTNGNETGSIVEVLGQNDNGTVTLLGNWKEVDLTGLGDAVKLLFSFDTNVENRYGPLYPLYFAFDDLTYVMADETDPTTTPEPSTLALVAIGLFGIGLRSRRQVKA